MNYKFEFVRHRNIFFAISGIITILGIISLLIFGLNLGIDFKSGSRLDIHIGKAFTDTEVKTLLKQAEDQAKAKGFQNVNLKPTVIRTAGNNNEIAVARFDQTVSKDVLPIIRSVFQSKYGSKVDIQESTVDPTIGRELARKAIYSVLWASLGIILYVTFRFEYRFAIAAIIALLHDAFFVITMFSIFRLEVDITFIAAILTIVGYSVNDTIVIFDRIRDNLKKANIKRMDQLEDVVNLSLNQTLSRSINTVLTVFITALALFIFGGSGIHNFSLALLFGLFTGAYSSIFIASQIWVVWKGRDFKKKRVQLKEA
ncbi:preprotein translocase subunit SecF/SecD/SecF fusion protein [Tepidibacillus fermentans]|uniref:Protein-export membrane protein SecF n=1 Tax=Tepidibacillus fermentans TaxID=1281767 RepID=A0A4R3KLV2_9BACI|nr:protein translocase subunit SecF [Tepidibacillus fermentans]TCS83833.1 preprotein translocase subunit SecF/SecD/SecF fusion protein [Tepidibacillus fermentans]